MKSRIRVMPAGLRAGVGLGPETGRGRRFPSDVDGRGFRVLDVAVAGVRAADMKSRIRVVVAGGTSAAACGPGPRSGAFFRAPEVALVRRRRRMSNAGSLTARAGLVDRAGPFRCPRPARCETGVAA